MPKGIYKRKAFTEEHRKNMSLNNSRFWKGKEFSKETREKMSKAGMNKKVSEETKLKMSKTRVGKKDSREAKLNKSRARIGMKFSDSHLQHLKDSHLEYKPTREAIRRSLRRRTMSSLEVRFNEILRKHSLPYKFVGNGKVLVGRKNPDFVNVNGEKKAVEVYYKKHKELLRGNLEEWKSERLKIFKKHGWELLFFDETEVRENTVLTKLMGVRQYG